MSEMRFGFHISIAGGFRNVRKRAETVGCETLQMFSRNPRGWAAAELDEADVVQFRKDMEEAELEPLFVHAPYLPNLAAAERAVAKRSVAALVEDLKRCQLLGVEFLICHVGKALGTEEERAIELVAENVNRIFEAAPNRVKLLLENTAGMGSEVGYRFEQIGTIVKKIGDKDRVGVVLDTAHAFEAGYEWRTKTGIDETLRQFDRAIGLGRLYLLHLNDSKTEFGSRVDRHWHIGQGKIGPEGFRLIVNHPLLKGLPGIMETPRTGTADDLRNLKTIRSLVA
ncbi:MAG: deoxyribonuclease IV [candidate division WOR-3 bacterium]